MGAWSTGPIDNDTAADWLSETIGPVREQIDTALAGDDPDLHRTAAFLLERVGYVYVYPPDEPEEDVRGLETHLRLAVERLEALRENDDWLALWEDPEGVAMAINAQLEILRERREDATAPRSVLLMDRIEDVGGETPKRASDQDVVSTLKRKLMRE